MNASLLSEIQKGKGLKKAVTNDRSAPVIDGAGKAINGARPPANATSTGTGGGGVAAAAMSQTGPQLGGLFAGGIPKLKPANTLGKPPPLGRPPVVPRQTSNTSLASTAPPPRPPPGPPPAPPSAQPPVLPARGVPAPPTRAPPPPARSTPALPPSRSTPAPPTPPPAAPPPPPVPSPARRATTLQARSDSPGSEERATPPRRALPPLAPPNGQSSPPSPASENHGPLLPARQVPTVPARKVPPAIGNKPKPPPPPRPVSLQVNGSISNRAVPPPPPPRGPSSSGPRRNQTLSEGVADSKPPARGAPPPPPGPSPAARVRTVSETGTAPPLLTAVSPAVAALRAQHTGPAAPSSRRSKIPEPPLTSSGQTWPKQTDLPPPRVFETGINKVYPSGKSRGTDFKASSLV